MSESGDNRDKMNLDNITLPLYERSGSVSSLASSLGKRKRGEDVMDVECELRTLTELNEAMHDIKAYLVERHKSSVKVSQTLVDTLMGKIQVVSDFATRLGLENAQLKGRLQERDLSATSYRDALVSRGSTVPSISGLSKKIVPRKTFAAIIKAQEGSEEVSSDAVKAKIANSIDAVRDKIKIRNIRKIRDGVVVETATVTDLDKILHNEALRESGLVAAKSKKQEPRIIIYDVPTSFNEVDIKNALLMQNEDAFVGLNLDKVKDSIVLKFRTGKKEQELNNCVLEVSPEIRNILRRRETVYVDLRSCRVCDYYAISRGYKCQALGHIAKFCQADKEICGLCAEDGHSTMNCNQKNKLKTRRCAMCRRIGKPYEHPPDSNCPVYKAAIERLRMRTDYG